MHLGAAGLDVRHPLELVDWALAPGPPDGWRPEATGRGAAVADEPEDIRRRLERISEELADVAIQRLRDSIDAGGTELPIDERRLTRARRAVERAIGILGEANDAE